MPNYTHASTYLSGCNNDIRKRHHISVVQANNELPHQRYKMQSVAPTECPALSASWSENGSYDTNQAYPRQQPGYHSYADANWQPPQEYTRYDYQQQPDGFPGTSTAHAAPPPNIQHQSGFQQYNSLPSGSQASNNTSYQSWHGSSQPFSFEVRRFSPPIVEPEATLNGTAGSQSMSAYPPQQHQAMPSSQHMHSFHDQWAGYREGDPRNEGGSSYASAHATDQYAPRQHGGLYLHGRENSWNERPVEHRVQQQIRQEQYRHEERAFVRYRIGDGHHPHSPVQRTMRHRRNPKQWESSMVQADGAVPASEFVEIMALPSDRACLTVYQMLLRQSLEYFAATQHDVEARVRGRKQKIRLGQIGVRCRYCSHLQVQHRGKGAVYYPKTLINVYQAAQNIAGAHFCSEDFSCPFVPITIAEEIDVQRPRRDASKAGRTYWIEACTKMGIVEEDGGLWMRGGASTNSKAEESRPASVPAP